MFRHVIAVIVAVSTLVPGFLVARTTAGQLTAPAARKASPDFRLSDSAGSTVTLSGYRGKVVLLDFWATWCTGCKVEIPWYSEFLRKYQGQGLAAIGVAMDDEGWAVVRPFLTEHPIGYSIVVGDFDLLQGTFGLPPSLPITLLIDRHGRIAESHVGLVVKESWENSIRVLLQEE